MSSMEDSKDSEPVHSDDSDKNVNSDVEMKNVSNDTDLLKSTESEESCDNVKNETEADINDPAVSNTESSTNAVDEDISSSSDSKISTEASLAVSNEKDTEEEDKIVTHPVTLRMETGDSGKIDDTEKYGLSEEELEENKSFKLEEGEEEFKGFPSVDESQVQDIVKLLSEREENELQQLQVLVQNQNTEPLHSPTTKRKRGEIEESDLSSHCSSPALSISSQLSALSFSKRSRTGSPASRGSRKSNVDLSNPKYLVPFEFGWRREVVTRGISAREDGISRDVYYFHPSGKKLRSLREVSEKLTPGVTIENFTFYKEPLGADPKFETIRNARCFGQSPSEHTKAASVKAKVEKTSIETPPPPPAPKETPKGVTPLKNFVKTPKETISKPLPPPPPAKREKLVLKFNKGTPKIALKKPAAAVSVNGERKSPKMLLTKLEGPKPHPNAPSGPRRKITPRKKPLKPQNNNKDERRNRSEGGDLEMGMLPPLWSPTGASAKTSSNESLSWSHLDEKSANEESRLDYCTIRCTKAMGLIPTLQCSICLCLYHPECCDMGPISSYRPLKYVCKNCQAKAADTKGRGLVKHITPAVVTCDKSPPIISPKPIHPVINSPVTPSAPVASRMPHLMRPKVPGSKSVGGVTWLPPSNTVFRSPSIPKTNQIKSEEASTPPQAIVNMNSKRYIVVPKHNVLSVASNQSVSPAKADPAQSTTIITPTPTSTIIQGPPLQNNPFIQPSANSPGVLLVPYLTGESTTADSNSQCLVVNPVPGSSATHSSSQPDLPIGSETPDHFAKKVDKNAQRQSTDGVDESMQKFMRNICIGYTALLNVFQYLKVQELLRAGRVCRLWRDIAGHSSLWRTVRMKNSQVSDWKGFTDSLSRHGTKHLDLRKMLVSLDETEEMWMTFAKHIANVKCLERLDMCRCSVNVIEQIIEACPHLLVFNAQMIGVKDQTTHQKITLENLSKMKNLRELRMKSFFGLHLNLGSVEVQYIGKLHNLEALELGECSDLPENFPSLVIGKLLKLKRIRLEKGPWKCSTNEMLYEMSKLKDLMQLELINFDIRPGFDEALASCANIKRLLLIPTYVTQSATTNNIILSGAFKLWKTLTHFVWVVTMELLKVTELFVDQCEGKGSRKSGGNSVPVLKPVPIPEVRNSQKDAEASKEENITGTKNPTPITVIPIDELFEMLKEALPNTRVKLLKIPFQNTWRQSITEGSA
ncbi:UNVERIFIED_CONTAM: hypothetical protein PYX00_009333 [Menopon gallinae]|uniref:MBD domain-containing protein n=1 Tax=Menopon gallinae TaxID=328185 RepID=A0AAW2HB76_9NEOP